MVSEHETVPECAGCIAARTVPNARKRGRIRTLCAAQNDPAYAWRGDRYCWSRDLYERYGYRSMADIKLDQGG